MSEKKFVFKVRRDSQPEPSDFAPLPFSCLDFFSSLQSFIEHNFEGAITVDFPEAAHGCVVISPRGFAFFIRVLLSEIYGSRLVTARVYSEKGEITMVISKAGGLRSKEKLKSIAERSGFSFLEDGDTLILRTPLRAMGEMFLYAKDNFRLINYFYEVFLM